MSYAIANIVYGFPINDKQRTIIQQLSEAELGGLSEDEIDELEDGSGRLAYFGFTGLYSSGGDWDIGYCGVKLCSYDEGMKFKVSELSRIHATPEQKKEAARRIAALRPDLRSLADPVDVWVVWSSG